VPFEFRLPAGRSYAVFAHQPLHTAQADPMTSTLQLAVHAPRSVGSHDLGMDALQQGHGLRVRHQRGVPRVRGDERERAAIPS
jgi:hypothetical protein